jgi:hypothetical protein
LLIVSLFRHFHFAASRTMSRAERRLLAVFMPPGAMLRLYADLSVTPPVSLDVAVA